MADHVRTDLVIEALDIAANYPADRRAGLRLPFAQK